MKGAVQVAQLGGELPALKYNAVRTQTWLQHHIRLPKLAIFSDSKSTALSPSVRCSAPTGKLEARPRPQCFLGRAETCRHPDAGTPSAGEGAQEKKKSCFPFFMGEVKTGCVSVWWTRVWPQHSSHGSPCQGESPHTHTTGGRLVIPGN